MTTVQAQKKVNKAISVYVTAEKTDMRMEKIAPPSISIASQPFENEVAIFVDTLSKFQKLIGIGGALTDASAETFYKLSPEKQKELINLYYDENEGIGYSFGRTNINSCDFSSDMYTYVNEGDKTLSSFDISHDRKYKIPFIKEALKATNGKMKMFVSPWSPPAYMKDNNNMLQGGKLLPEFYQTWADYYIKFIKAYEKEGIPIWGLTVQNEPMAKQTWESCIYTAEEELQFVKKYLGPTLFKHKMSQKKLIAWDHNRDLLYHRAEALLHDKLAAKYIWGIGFHWYEVWTGGRQYDNVRRVKETFPSTNVLLTEACNYPFDWKTIDQWQWGEYYGENMIQDFNNGAVAWTDWNILLDETGGPNHVNNFCFAPVHARTGENSLYKMNSYYYIGHFSKFIRPGAVRLAVSTNRAQILSTAFKNADGSIAIVIMNKAGEKYDFKIQIGQQAMALSLLPHSIMTVVL
jgi:glucosylceramidase